MTQPSYRRCCGCLGLVQGCRQPGSGRETLSAAVHRTNCSA
ncbi:hypothetical protein ACFSEO_05245 [Agromyces cerinus subsp. nitratus]